MPKRRVLVTDFLQEPLDIEREILGDLPTSKRLELARPAICTVG